MVPQVRAAALTNYVEVARFVGLDPYAMLRAARINPATLADPDHLISRNAAAQLLDDSACASGCAAFGLLMAQSRSLNAFGALGLLLMHEGTARGVVEALIRYQALLSEAHAIALEEDGDIAVVHTNFAGGIGSVQSVELLTGVICRTISEVTAGRWHPDCVHLAHKAPDDLSIHRRVFQCPLIFESDYNGLVCPTASLDTPNPAAESAMARHARRYLDMLIPDPADGTITERARRSLYLLVPTGRATLEQASANLGLHPRMLQRMLVKEGRTFATLLGEVRRELALRYLSGSTHSVAAIAQMAGYASASSFTRWFVAEFGMAPAAWRAEERQEEEPSLIPA